MFLIALTLSSYEIKERLWAISSDEVHKRFDGGVSLLTAETNFSDGAGILISLVSKNSYFLKPPSPDLTK